MLQACIMERQIPFSLKAHLVDKGPRHLVESGHGRPLDIPGDLSITLKGGLYEESSYAFMKTIPRSIIFTLEVNNMTNEVFTPLFDTITLSDGSGNYMALTKAAEKGGKPTKVLSLAPGKSHTWYLHFVPSGVVTFIPTLKTILFWKWKLGGKTYPTASVFASKGIIKL